MGEERIVVEDFKQFGGKHCWTTAQRNVFRFLGLDLSEEMWFGLGGGLGFIYWYMKKMPAPFVGGRQGRGLDPLQKPCEWAGGSVSYVQTASAKKGYDHLKETLRHGKPAILFVDMAYLPYMVIPEEAHFGAHTIVVYGVDEAADAVYVSDRGRGPLTLTVGELGKARASKHPPFPPKHGMLTVDYPAHEPTYRDHLVESMRSCCVQMLRSPIKNVGLEGINFWADMVLKWPTLFPRERLFTCLFNVFTFIEVSGTGGSAFRLMYAKFLEESAELLGRRELRQVAGDFRKAGEAWSEIAVAALPDWWPTLKKIRELLTEKNRVFEEQRPDAHRRMVEISAKLDEHWIKKAAVREFRDPDAKAIKTLMESLSEAIRKLYPVEKEAFRHLNELAAG